MNGLAQASEQLDQKLMEFSGYSLKEMTEKETGGIPDFLQINYAIELI